MVRTARPASRSLTAIDAFTQALPTSVGIDTAVNPYHSYDWSQVFSDLGPVITSGVEDTKYLSSVASGIADLAQMIADQQATCGGKTKLILTGHSEGAEVTGDDLYQSLSAAARANVLGVALFADPRFNHNDSSATATGFQVAHQLDLPHNGLMQIFTAVGARKPFDSRRVLEYCHVDDPVCQNIAIKVGNTLVLNVGTFLGLVEGTHSAYGSRGDAADAGTSMASLAMLKDGSPKSGNFALTGPCVADGTSIAPIASSIPYSDPEGDDLVGIVVGQPASGTGTLSVPSGTYLSLANLHFGLLSFEWAPGVTRTTIAFQARDFYGATSRTYKVTLTRTTVCGQLTVNPSRGPVGSSVAVSATGFKAPEPVAV